MFGGVFACVSTYVLSRATTVHVSREETNGDQKGISRCIIAVYTVESSPVVGSDVNWDCGASICVTTVAALALTVRVGSVKILLRWMLVGALVPLGVVLVFFIPVLIAGGLNAVPTNLGILMLTMATLVPTGLLIGFILGLIDIKLRAYVLGAEVEVRRKRAFVASASSFLFLLVAILTISIVTSLDGFSVESIVFHGPLALITSIVASFFAYVYYARIARADVTPSISTE